MILAAGKGTRLGALTRELPKPLISLAGKPLIVRQLEQLSAAGISDVVINLHHLGEQIEQRLGSGARFGMRIRYSKEKTLLETGGGLVQALPLLGGEPFWLLNGDIFTDFEFARLPRRLEPDVDLHLLLKARPAAREHGDFDFARGRVTGRGEAYVYCGISVVHPRLLAGKPRAPFSFRELMFSAVAAGRTRADLFEGHWYDIGTPEQLAAARRLLEARSPD